jgi:hypothetical protein
MAKNTETILSAFFNRCTEQIKQNLLVTEQKTLLIKAVKTIPVKKNNHTANVSSARNFSTASLLVHLVLIGCFWQSVSCLYQMGFPILEETDHFKLFLQSVFLSFFLCLLPLAIELNNRIQLGRLLPLAIELNNRIQLGRLLPNWEFQELEGSLYQIIVNGLIVIVFWTVFLNLNFVSTAGFPETYIVSTKTQAVNSSNRLHLSLKNPSEQVLELDLFPSQLGLKEQDFRRGQVVVLKRAKGLLGLSWISQMEMVSQSNQDQAKHILIWPKPFNWGFF